MDFSFVLTLALLIQGTAVNPPDDALDFLNRVTQRYSDAKSYHIEATLERVDRNELSHNWHKTLLTAIVAPGGRYRFEGRSAFGSAVFVSNGTTKWNYHLDEHQYTETAAAAGDSEKRHFIPQEEIRAHDAQLLVADIRSLSTHHKSASFLPDETVAVGGRSIECRVVRFTGADFISRKPDYKVEETVWVDKSRNLIVKTVLRIDGYRATASGAHIPLFTEETTVFNVVQLDEQEPESSFDFSPPSDAKLVACFPDPSARSRPLQTAEFVGKPAPEIRLIREGKEIPLSSYRGKPVFVEFWAIWCGPCVALIPDLKKLYAETASKGLVWVSIENEEDASDAAKFVKEQQIPWPNYHDEDGTLGRVFGLEGVPLGVLIDPEGKVTFYSVGYDISELRAAVASLGPEFSSVAGPSATPGAAPPKP
ncbi:MAG TPA: TlpA disulfide reductase family protein [Terriglobia bacterium]|nr:TlpA disulfide reductase family protein [Terriglobia bacterium]